MDEDIFEIKKWIRFAQEDYNSAVARAKAVGNPYSPRQVCYDGQQSAEKILKAYTIAKDGARNKEHRLDLLLIQCRRHSYDFDILGVACSALNEHITKSRYPSDKEKIGRASCRERVWS
jgi:HEPN domain-containing protein